MKKNANDFFANNLKKLIAKNNIKQSDLAKHLGLSKGAISNYLSGMSVPKIETILKIASFFGVDIDYFIKTDSKYNALSLQENNEYVCNIPLFHNELISKDVIYRADNYLGNITVPIFLKKGPENYAVVVRDELLNSYGISKGNIVIFDSEIKPETGDLAVVLHRPSRHILIRRIEYNDKQIILHHSTGSDEYSIAKGYCDVAILGKVTYATFDPNTK